MAMLNFNVDNFFKQKLPLAEEGKLPLCKILKILKNNTYLFLKRVTFGM